MSDTALIYFAPGFEPGSWQAAHFVDELPRYGVDVVIERGGPPEPFTARMRALKGKYRHLLLLAGFLDANCPRELIALARSLDIPTVLICYDNLQAPFLHRRTAALYDVVWLTSPENQVLFRAWGARTIYLPYAANPYVFSPDSTAGEELRYVSFIGTPYGPRWDRLCALSHHSIPVALFSDPAVVERTCRAPIHNLLSGQTRLGSALQLLRFAAGRQCVWAGLKKTLFYKRPHADRHFLEFRGRVSFREMVHIYRSSSLVLGTLDVWNTFVLRTPLLKIHLRAFEVPMSAGISLCNRSDALCTMFREDHEMICYGSQDELVDKAAFWLQDSQAAERARIRSRARQRSVQDHSWGRRFQVLFSETGIPWPTAGQPVP